MFGIMAFDFPKKDWPDGVLPISAESCRWIVQNWLYVIGETECWNFWPGVPCKVVLSSSHYVGPDNLNVLIPIWATLFKHTNICYYLSFSLGIFKNLSTEDSVFTNFVSSNESDRRVIWACHRRNFPPKKIKNNLQKMLIPAHAKSLMHEASRAEQFPCTRSLCPRRALELLLFVQLGCNIPGLSGYGHSPSRRFWAST